MEEPVVAPLTKRQRRAAAVAAPSTILSESAFAHEDLTVFEAQGIVEDRVQVSKVYKAEAEPRKVALVEPKVVVAHPKNVKSAKGKKPAAPMTPAVEPILAPFTTTEPAAPFDRQSISTIFLEIETDSGNS